MRCAMYDKIDSGLIPVLQIFKIQISVSVQQYPARHDGEWRMFLAATNEVRYFQQIGPKF